MGTRVRKRAARAISPSPDHWSIRLHIALFNASQAASASMHSYGDGGKRRSQAASDRALFEPGVRVYPPDLQQQDQGDDADH